MGICYSRSLEHNEPNNQEIKKIQEIFQHQNHNKVRISISIPTPVNVDDQQPIKKQSLSISKDNININNTDNDQKTPDSVVDDINIEEPSSDNSVDYKSYLNFSDNNGDNDDKYNELDSSEYEVDYKHVELPVAELTDKISVTDDHAGTKLLDIFDKIEVNATHLSMWKLWSGSFTNKDAAKSKLKTVLDYGETNPSSPRIKTQLRVITKLIMEKGLDKSEEYVHVLLLLASHGGVCNVMKDVAINNAYGMLTECLTSVIKLQSLEQQILKELRKYRHILVEELHLKFKFNTNQHTVNGFYNEIADDVGLIKYSDPNISKPYGTNSSIYKKGLKERFFKTLYNKENIIKRIYRMIDEKKISYQKIVQFYQDNCPSSVNKMVFLQQAIDIDNGKIMRNYLCFLLQKLNIFLIKSDNWKDIEKCWDDIK